MQVIYFEYFLFVKNDLGLLRMFGFVKNGLGLLRMFWVC